MPWTVVPALERSYLNPVCVPKKSLVRHLKIQKHLNTFLVSNKKNIRFLPAVTVYKDPLYILRSTSHWESIARGSEVHAANLAAWRSWPWGSWPFNPTPPPSPFTDLWEKIIIGVWEERRGWLVKGKLTFDRVGAKSLENKEVYFIFWRTKCTVF